MTDIENREIMLTKREKEILELLCSGMSTKDMAEKLYLSGRTIGFHRNNIYSKLNVNSSLQAFRRAISLGLHVIHTPTNT